MNIKLSLVKSGNKVSDDRKQRLLANALKELGFENLLEHKSPETVTYVFSDEKLKVPIIEKSEVPSYIQ